MSSSIKRKRNKSENVLQLKRTKIHNGKFFLIFRDICPRGLKSVTHRLFWQTSYINILTSCSKSFGREKEGRNKTDCKTRPETDASIPCYCSIAPQERVTVNSFFRFRLVFRLVMQIQDQRKPIIFIFSSPLFSTPLCSLLVWNTR